MGKGLLLLALALLAPVLLQADETAPEAANPYRTTNFEVTAPTVAMARRIGLAAERVRRKQARLWLGKELPAWPARCPLEAKISLNGNGGATTFAFDDGNILSREMRVEGTAERVLDCVLPHEVTHTILAEYFGRPVPRWADEGAAILAENSTEQKRHRTLTRKILTTPGRAIPLRRLFKLTQYPRDVLVLYAQGYSVTSFLVEAKDRKTFLKFVKEGLQGDWDRAVRRHYGYASVEKLEEAWLQTVRGKEAVKAEAETRLP